MAQFTSIHSGQTIDDSIAQVQQALVVEPDLGAALAKISTLETRLTNLENRVNILGWNYSFTEQDSGRTWVNGKKIYFKTYQFNVGTGTPPITVIVVLEQRPDIDQLIFCEYLSQLDNGSGSKLIPGNISTKNGANQGDIKVELTTSGQLQANIFAENNTVVSRIFNKSGLYVTPFYTKV